MKKIKYYYVFKILIKKVVIKIKKIVVKIYVKIYLKIIFFINKNNEQQQINIIISNLKINKILSNL